MTVSSTLTFDETPPRRPGLTDIASGTKEDDPGATPDPATMPTADEDNQKTKQAAAAAKMIALARITVTFASGTPSISHVSAPGTNVTADNFTVVDNGAGDTTIWWTANEVLPPTAGGPTVSQCDDTEIDRLRAFATTVSGNPAVRVKSKLGATATDANFVVSIY